tara:strand:+ start:516 stop:788 length:273 start_codon:yes stop_codon:yes gene_type:complete
MKPGMNLAEIVLGLKLGVSGAKGTNSLPVTEAVTEAEQGRQTVRAVTLLTTMKINSDVMQTVMKSVAVAPEMLILAPVQAQAPAIMIAAM